MPVRSFNLDAKANRDLEKLRKLLADDGRKLSASSVVRKALTQMAKGRNTERIKLNP